MIVVIAICRPVCFRIGEVFRGLWLVLPLLAEPAAGLTLTTTSEALSGPGWQARGVELRLAMADAASLRLSIAELRLPEPLPAVANLTLECRQLDHGSDDWRCADFTLEAVDTSARGSLRYWPKSGRVVLELDELYWQGHRLRTTRVDYTAEHWSLDTEIQALAASPDWLPALDLAVLQGRIGGRAQLSGDAAGVQRVETTLQTRQLDFSSHDGRHAAEGLQLGLNAVWRMNSDFELSLRFMAGELYLEPWYWVREVGQAPLVLSLSGDWRNERLLLDRLQLDHPDVVRLDAELVWQSDATIPLQRAVIRLPATELSALYGQYLQPLAFATLFEALEVEGRIGGELLLEQQRPTRVVLDLQGIDVREADGRFGVHDLTGRLHWGEAARSRLHWREAGIHRIVIGAGELQLDSRPGRIELSTPSRIPVLDGVLVLQQLAMTPDAEVQVRFGGRLDGLSMAALSAALDWPPLSGSLSGVIPRVSYRGHRLDVDGALLIRAFGGDLTVANLRLDRPFETLPELNADIELFNLDLTSVTQTFDIGRIEGRLNGHVRDLQLLDWRPVAFDAYLHTPEGDTSRRRISQRAVETISDLGGGGAAGALSRGFLGLFEDFSYARMGVGCRLQQGVCNLRGLGPSPDGQGFHLIEGRGLPRIDVIGYNRRVDWAELLARLQAAARSEGPVIQ